jgi:hypothetical protein
MQKRRDRFREEMVAQIRSEAAPLAADQKYQVEPDIRRRFQARGGDEEG